MKTKHIIGLAVIHILLVLFAMGAAAQTNGVPTTDPRDAAVQGWFSQFSAWQMFLVPAVTVLVMGFRKFVSVVPDQLWPWLAPFIGAGLDYVASKAGLWTGSGEVGALMGGLAVWFSQLMKQTKELATDGPSSTVSGASNQKPTVPPTT